LVTNQDEISNLYRRCFLPSFGLFGKVVSDEKIFSKSTNQKEEWPVAACLLTDQAEMSNLYSEPSKDASYQVMIHLARRSQRRRYFRN
jgi:hypothetical protein